LGKQKFCETSDGKLKICGEGEWEVWFGDNMGISWGESDEGAVEKELVEIWWQGSRIKRTR
jgi:hypothetical protein